MKHTKVSAQKKRRSARLVVGIKKYFRMLFWSPFALMVIFCLLFLYALSYFMSSSLLVETESGDNPWSAGVESGTYQKKEEYELMGSLFSKPSSSEDPIVVAVLDSGIDVSHSDLFGNLWMNAAEDVGLTGRDDDGNGYVDDIFGWDFVNGDADVVDAKGTRNPFGGHYNSKTCSSGI